MCSVLTLLLVATLSAAEDYSIKVNSLGVGNAWVSGAVTPLHLSVSSNVNEATTAWVQWEVPDADGDTVLWGKQITLTPGRSSSTWLYAPVQPWATSSTVWNVRLREWNGSEPEGELAVTKFTPISSGALKIESDTGVIAVFGTSRLGLSGYEPQPQDVKQEATIIVSGLQHAELPDAWPCLETLDAIVWANELPQGKNTWLVWNLL